jgi:hypothetical protein
MKVKFILSIFIILMVFGINFGNSPLPPPYYKYIVTGSVLCDTLIDKSNFTIRLYGKSNNYQDTYKPILTSRLGYEIPIVITDTTGFYYLNVNNEFFYDSIKVALINHSNPTVFSEPYFIDKNLNIAIEEVGNDIETSGGCSSCSSEPTQVRRIIRYEYNLATSIIYCN